MYLLSIIFLYTRHNMASAQENEEKKRRRPPVVTMEETHERQPPGDGEAGADLPPSYTEVQEYDLPRYDTIPEDKKRSQV